MSDRSPFDVFKSMDWFPYDRDLSHARVKELKFSVYFNFQNLQSPKSLQRTPNKLKSSLKTSKQPAFSIFEDGSGYNKENGLHSTFIF